MEFSRQEYWSGLPFPSPGDLPNPGIEPRSPVLQADALLSEPPGKPLSCLRCWNTEALVRNLVSMCQTLLTNSQQRFYVIFCHFVQDSNDSFRHVSTAEDPAPQSVVFIYKKKVWKANKGISLSLKTTETKSMPRFLLDTCSSKDISFNIYKVKKGIVKGQSNTYIICQLFNMKEKRQSFFI